MADQKYLRREERVRLEGHPQPRHLGFDNLMPAKGRW